MPLSRSERIGYIKEIASRMSNDDYNLIDLTLKQFALPTESIWNGSLLSYVLEMIQTADDEILIELGEHVGYTPLGPVHRPKLASVRAGQLRLFISHLATERVFAGNLRRSLQGFGIEAFVAHDDISPTSEWQAKIEAELRSCDSLVALLHPDFHRSNWTDQEMGFVMGRGLPVFTVRLGQDPYGFIGRFQAFNGLKKNPPQLAQELFEAYRSHEQTKGLMTESVLKLFENSSSFALATRNVRYLEDLEVWEPAYIERIKAALANNSQISGAYGVKARVDALAIKWDPIPF